MKYIFVTIISFKCRQLPLVMGPMKHFFFQIILYVDQFEKSKTLLANQKRQRQTDRQIDRDLLYLFKSISIATLGK